MTSVFEEDDDDYTGPPLTEALVRNAEERLGVRLPESYLRVLRERNGGLLRARCFPTAFPTSWAPDHFEIEALRGIGGEWGIDSRSGLGSDDLVREWGYPHIGVVIFAMPSGGHDAVMLDYQDLGPDGEPGVAYVDEDRVPRRVASSLGEFLSKLVECGQIRSW